MQNRAQRKRRKQSKRGGGEKQIEKGEENESENIYESQEPKRDTDYEEKNTERQRYLTKDFL